MVSQCWVSACYQYAREWLGWHENVRLHGYTFPRVLSGKCRFKGVHAFRVVVIHESGHRETFVFSDIGETLFHETRLPKAKP